MQFNSSMNTEVFLFFWGDVDIQFNNSYCNWWFGAPVVWIGILENERDCC